MSDPQHRIAALAAADAQRRTAARDANRSASPEFAAFVDEIRRVFGGCRVRYLRLADGSERGKRGDAGVVPALARKQAAKRR